MLETTEDGMGTYGIVGKLLLNMFLFIQDRFSLRYTRHRLRFLIFILNLNEEYLLTYKSLTCDAMQSKYYRMIQNQYKKLKLIE